MENGPFYLHELNSKLVGILAFEIIKFVICSVYFVSVLFLFKCATVHVDCQIALILHLFIDCFCCLWLCYNFVA